MLERYYVRPETLDRIRSAWIGPLIDQYATWMLERGYSARNLAKRVPLLLNFGAFAERHGATDYGQLPTHVEAFIDAWIHRPDRRHGGVERPASDIASDLRGPIQQMVRLAVPGFIGRTRRRLPHEPFVAQVAAFFSYLRQERGLSDHTIEQYVHHLWAFEAYLKRIGLESLRTLSPVVVSSFLTERGPRLRPGGIRNCCSILRVFLAYLHRSGLVARDLTAIVEAPPAYRLAHLPRSITWEQVQQMLDGIDRRTALGRRDYAMLLLLVTYGLRGREVAALRLEDLDWRQGRLRIPERKAGHSTAYPLSPLVGNALADYLKQGRPATSARQVFLRMMAPYIPVTYVAISARVGHYLRRAGIAVSRAGSHTLRHSCVQRLVDAGWSLKHIGDYVGHTSPASTEIYSKVAVESLREVACGDGEDIL
jgi:site-specific recombinase XerD